MITNIFETREVNHTPHSLQEVTKDLSSLPEAFKGTYIQIKNRWGYTARISLLLEMIQFSYGIKEWELLDLRNINNGDMESKWMDSLINYSKGEKVDFGEIWENIKKEGMFSTRELNLIETGEIDLRLWAIYTLLVNQNLQITY